MDPEVFAQARLRMDQLTKPPRALGYLEEVALRLAALQGRVKPELGRRPPPPPLSLIHISEPTRPY